MSHKVAIIGRTTLTAALALSLSKAGHAVNVIERPEIEIESSHDLSDAVLLDQGPSIQKPRKQKGKGRHKHKSWKK